MTRETNTVVLWTPWRLRTAMLLPACETFTAETGYLLNFFLHQTAYSDGLTIVFRFVDQFLLHPAPVGAPRSEYNTSDKFREVYQTVPPGVGLLCVKIMLDATHLTGSCIVRPSEQGSNRPSVTGDGRRKALPAYISVANQKMATSRQKESRELLAMLATLGQGYNAREKKSVKFKTRSWTLLQEQLEIVMLDGL